MNNVYRDIKLGDAGNVEAFPSIFRNQVTKTVKKNSEWPHKADDRLRQVTVRTFHSFISLCAHWCLGPRQQLSHRVVSVASSFSGVRSLASRPTHLLSHTGLGPSKAELTVRTDATVL
jgi:hypothetical protein